MHSNSGSLPAEARSFRVVNLAHGLYVAEFAWIHCCIRPTMPRILNYGVGRLFARHVNISDNKVARDFWKN